MTSHLPSKAASGSATLAQGLALQINDGRALRLIVEGPALIAQTKAHDPREHRARRLADLSETGA